MARLPCRLAPVAAGVLALIIVLTAPGGRVDAARMRAAPAGVETPTDTPTATDTPTPTPTPTDTPPPLTPTPPAAPAWVMKAPRGSDDNVIVGGSLPLVNVFVCSDEDPEDEPDGLCDLENEGRLVFIEQGYSPSSPLGAFAFRLAFDDTIFAIDLSCVTPQDPAPACTGDADDDGIVNTDADTWDIRISQQLDNDPLRAWGMDACVRTVTPGKIAFGCQSDGPPDAGETGATDIAEVTLRPYADLAERLPNSGVNSVVRVLRDENCMLVDSTGAAVAGSIAGGVTAGCGDLAVTVRILEGDVNLDCRVDLRDVQASAQRYGIVVGDLLFHARYDLEPDPADFDIDAKDVQKVAGRLTSTCQHPLPPQPPIDPTIEG